MRAVAFDTETFYSSKLKYSIKGNLPEDYATHELFDCYCVSVCDGSTSWSGHPRDFNWSTLDGALLLSNNKRFDQAILQSIVNRGLAPKANIAGWECVANLTAYLCNRRSLDQAVEYLFQQRVDKTARANADGKHWPQDFSPQERVTMLEYARKDAEWTYRLWESFGGKWPADERRLSNLTIAQGIRGVKINTELLDNYIIWSHEMKSNTEKLLPWLRDVEDETWDDFNTKPTSTKCIVEQCKRSGIPAPPIKAREGEEAYQQWEATYSSAHPWVAALSSWRSINKLYQTFLLAKSRLRADGMLPFSLKYFGAHCLPGYAEVLTKNGWVALANWSGGEIAQWSPDGNICFKSAVPNQFKNYDELLLIDAPYFKGSFTLGHTMPFFTHGKSSFSTCKAGDFCANKSRFVPISGDWKNNTPAIDVNEMQILIAVQADGHWLPENEGGGLQFCLRKPRKIIRIKQLLLSANIKFREQEFSSTPNQIRISISRKDCPVWLSRDKKIFGPWLLNSTYNARKVFLDEILLWDGHIKTREYGSAIYENVEWVVTIAHLTGCAACAPKKRLAKGNRAPYYRTIIRDTKKALIFSNQCSASKENMVYCPTTETGFFMFRFLGTIAITGNTGRWSGDARINFQNFRKRPVLCNLQGLMEMSDSEIDDALKTKKETGQYPEWVRYEIDFRKLIIPRPGKRLIVSDLAQIEPRVLAWLSGNRQLLEMLKSGMSLYEAHARMSMGYTGGKLNKDDPRYALAKAQVLALGYQAGWEKFIDMAYDYTGYDFTQDDPDWIEETNPFTGEIKRISGYGHTAKTIVAQFRKDNPKIVGLWQRLDEGFKRSIGGDFEIQLPSGRIMRYEDVRCSTKFEPDPETKIPRRRTVFTAGVGGKRSQFYGGKLTENITQAVARDVFGCHLLRLDDASVPVLFSSHDEAIAEADADVTPRDIEEIMSVTPEWLEGCPVIAEAKEVPYYCK